MFNKIQNYLLLRHPLLWNIKIVPVLLITLAIHVIFFLMGFSKGAIDFTSPKNRYNWDDDTPVIIFFSILLSIMVFIMWLVFYFRNNAFKSFYPKNNASLYKEWLLIFIVCLMNSTYTATFSFASDMRKTSYFSEKETLRRFDVISMASVFVNGTYTMEETVVETASASDTVAVATTVGEQNVTKKPISLLDKGVYRFGSHGYQYGTIEHRDSVNNKRVVNWLTKNQKDSVQWLFTEFEKIAAGHNLKANISPEDWLGLVYNYPQFTNYQNIAPTDGIDDDSYDYRGQRYYKPKYYVPLDRLTKSYEVINNAMNKPIIDEETSLAYLMAALSLSLLVFSFRVTSGRGWLIALVSLGIAAMITGLFSFAMREGLSYPIMWMLIIAGLLVYFLAITFSKTQKGISTTVLNCLLWLLMWLMPIVCMIIIASRSHNYNVEYSADYDTRSTLGYWLEHNIPLMLYINMVFVLVYMYFLTITIKKWKGIPES
jgi:hypothetical protein